MYAKRVIKRWHAIRRARQTDNYFIVTLYRSMGIYLTIFFILFYFYFLQIIIIYAQTTCRQSSPRPSATAWRRAHKHAE